MTRVTVTLLIAVAQEQTKSNFQKRGFILPCSLRDIFHHGRTGIGTVANQLSHYISNQEVEVNRNEDPAYKSKNSTS